MKKISQSMANISQLAGEKKLKFRKSLVRNLGLSQIKAEIEQWACKFCGCIIFHHYVCLLWAFDAIFPLRSNNFYSHELLGHFCRLFKL